MSHNPKITSARRILLAVVILAGCGTVTADPSDAGMLASGGKPASSSGGSGGSGSASGTGGSSSGGNAGAGGESCGANVLCSDGTCSSATDAKHCGPGCQICPSGETCTNSGCVYPSCDTVLPAPVMYNQGCSPAGSIVSKDGYDCFSACQYSQSVLPTTTECTFKNPITGPGASGLALCVLSCSECS